MRGAGPGTIWVGPGEYYLEKGLAFDAQHAGTAEQPLVLRGTGTGPTHIFSGDSLFPGGVGKTDSPADFASLLDDVTGTIFDRFCDQTIIHPGHGESTTLGAERPQLAQWRARGW